MSDNAAPAEDPIETDGEELGRAAKIWTGIVAVLAVGSVLAATLIWWSPWEAEEPPCVEDATRFVDDESGICLSIPFGWVRVDDAELADTEFTSLVEHESGNAWVGIGPVAEEMAAMSPEEAAGEIFGREAGNPGIQVDRVTVEGREAATAEAEIEVMWFQLTVIDADGTLIEVFGTTFSGEEGLIEQIKLVHGSLSVA
jgi:predicted Zn-dependent protease